MNKRCSVCNHPSRAEIDRGLLAGVSYRALAAPHGLSPSTYITSAQKTRFFTPLRFVQNDTLKTFAEVLALNLEP